MFTLNYDRRALEKLVRELDVFGKRVARKHLKAAARYASRPVVQAARQYAPRESGSLKRSIIAVVRKAQNREESYYVVVGPRVDLVAFYTSEKTVTLRGKSARTHKLKYRHKRVPANYAHLVELGVQPHALGRGSNTRRRLSIPHGQRHPGYRAKPFLRPAYLQHRNDYLKRIGVKLWEGIQKEASAVA